MLRVSRAAITSVIARSPSKARYEAICLPSLRYSQQRGLADKIQHIATLDRSHLTPSDYLQLSGLSTARIGDRLSLAPGCDLPVPPRADAKHKKPVKDAAADSGHLSATEDITYQWQEMTSQAVDNPFPQGTTGFLYYQSSTYRPALSGEIRFRLATDPSKEAFAGGLDLSRPNTLPWGISLLNIAVNPRHLIFRQLLLRDKLVTEELMERAASIAPSPEEVEGLNLIDSVCDPFVYDFGVQDNKCHVVGDDEILELQINSLGLDQRGRKRRTPYSGRAVLQFRYAGTLEYRVKPCYGLCVLVERLLEPIKCVIPSYDRYLRMPEEGRFLHRGDSLIFFKVSRGKSAHARAINLLNDRV
ncbi:uncharacterized protein LAESUDRAFT_573698 [Laetiporus sulphureus 93-53]|uniref:Uncharacterized protein n=1 Tax=Laetiporus sulphureus 93-53 TaxID=1314785 RepID=A0A165B2V4_9APHY|nr:uncharacterized protein LAESUDRAFT_573698 [Laetiporus sulphureus 93-53]KZT00117.1 hypothetical protein LAESUDRAFT_573698 [Laetiporus sulphureus 93-53]